ncbi:cytochrome C554 [Photobacterium gaetbulicola]|uniref:Putative cytochrome c n=1 Tax=Photobacterium gaetbulicola Gung47 TaxID=658445 RepID=A0A0C5WZ79_9GAMM|nr:MULTISPECIES: c-type cytochrome [Photobacterium]AJR08335.1 putative cytochrome c [Photobacterium gaetbulicola Gung47]PSU08991.1 cytochrome C554 [Photobacterium gaetbulicola]WEM43566.1 c-type cytochrome [Photobacterium sp. DA100]
MKRTLLFSLLYILNPLTISAAWSNTMPQGDSDAGKVKSFTCQFCHGQNGVAQKEGYPHINNQSPLYLYRAMQAYQNGERSGSYGDMMKQQLSVLNEQDLADIATYFGEQP